MKEKVKLIKAWYHNSLREGTLDIRYLLLWFEDEPGLLFFVMIFVYLLQGLFNIDAIMVLPLFWIVLGLSLSGAGFPESSIHNNLHPGKPGKISAEG